MLHAQKLVEQCHNLVTKRTEAMKRCDGWGGLTGISVNDYEVSVCLSGWTWGALDNAFHCLCWPNQRKIRSAKEWSPQYLIRCLNLLLRAEVKVNYRGQVTFKNSKNLSAISRCDTIIMDDLSASDTTTIPFNEIHNNSPGGSTGMKGQGF